MSFQTPHKSGENITSRSTYVWLCELVTRGIPNGFNKHKKLRQEMSPLPQFYITCILLFTFLHSDIILWHSQARKGLTTRIWAAF